MPADSPTDGDVASGINRLEGYLLYQSELNRARIEGDAFARRMPWLTTAQHEEVARLYAQQRLEVSKAVLREVAGRCAELRREYGARYETLRQRLLCRCAATLLCSAALCAAAVALAAHR
ncbi:hypothetical protein [Streptomyces sp. NPDC006307]|uniref:hypothetical protein n=1 Tax=Streptomyces sp. NPDC006307 TaxID=3156748 RepID=UPI0033BA112E